MDQFQNQHAPFVMRDSSSQRGYKGYCIDLLDTIAAIADFEYTITEVDEFGRMNEDGEWNGVMRKLIDEEADIGLGTMQVMVERERFVDFTIPFYDLVGYTVLMEIPHPKTTFFKFLTVLELNVWCCILGAYILTRFIFSSTVLFLYSLDIFLIILSGFSFLMYSFDRWSPYSYQNNREKYADDDEKREFSLRECLWFCITSLTPQVSTLCTRKTQMNDRFTEIIVFLLNRAVAKLPKVWFSF